MTRIEDVYRITEARIKNTEQLYKYECATNGENARYSILLSGELNALHTFRMLLLSESYARDIAGVYEVPLYNEVYLVITEYYKTPYEAFIELETDDLDKARNAARVFAADDKNDGPRASRTIIVKREEWESGNYEEIEYKEAEL